MTNAPRPELADSSLTAISHAERGSCCALTGEILAKCLHRTSTRKSGSKVERAWACSALSAVGHGRRSPGKAAMFRYKAIIGRGLRARTLPAQKTEANGSPDRLLGAEPDNAARHAGVATPRLKASPATAPCPPSELRTKAEHYHTDTVKALIEPPPEPRRAARKCVRPSPRRALR